MISDEQQFLERLKKGFTYDPQSGVFTHNIKKSFPVAGVVAGCKSPIGYTVINVSKKIYLAHRLAWLYVYGQWPKHCIDHINGNRSDNRISNLRDIPKAQNHQNLKGPTKANNARALGVHFSNKRKRFIAQIAIDKKRVYLGSYLSKEEAAQAYLLAKQKIHPSFSSESFCNI